MPVKIESSTALVVRTATPAANLAPALKAAIEDRKLQSSYVLLLDLSEEQDARTH